MVRDNESEARHEPEGGRIQASIAPTDLVFDFSDMEQMSVADLALLITARQLAEEEDRTVWAAGLPADTWRTLQALGLSELFQPFPVSEDRRA